MILGRPLEERIKEKPDTRLGKTLGIEVLCHKLIDEAMEARQADADRKIKKAVRRPYFFDKVVPVGRTPEGELIAVYFEVTVWNEPLPFPGNMTDLAWSAYVCAPEHYETLNQYIAREISEYQDIRARRRFHL